MSSSDSPFAWLTRLFTRWTQKQVCMTDLFYSFGTSYPGAITLHNYLRYLQQRIEPDGSIIDLATTEILWDRERGVPSYNAFRKLMHPVSASFQGYLLYLPWKQIKTSKNRPASKKPGKQVIERKGVTSCVMLNMNSRSTNPQSRSLLYLLRKSCQKSRNSHQG